MAERAESPAVWRWRAGLGRFRGQLPAIQLFVAAGVHVFPEPLSGWVVHGADASPLRRQLVGADAPVLRTCRLSGADAGFVVPADSRQCPFGRPANDPLPVDG